MLILVGVENGDTQEDVKWLASKSSALRIFDDENGVMNRSVVDVDGEILAVSQFTLLASTRNSFLVLFSFLGSSLLSLEFT